MKIIQVHNYYQQAGGEDSVVEAEASLLRSRGDVVIPFYKDNEALGSGLWALGKASVATLWNHRTYREFRELLKNENPDVVHCHNTFPLISPSIYWACAKEKVPVVQTLHNYRLLCLNAFLFRNVPAISPQPSAVSKDEGAKGQKLEASGSICEECLTKSFKWPGIKYRCYRNSFAGSLVVALMLFFHKLLGTWSKKVTAYIALTEFQKQKMIEGGLPEDKVWVKPNFIERSAISGQQSDGREQKSEKDGQPPTTNHQLPTSNSYALFVGRLSPEKGCDVLIRAWAKFQQSAEDSQISDLGSPTSGNNQPQLIIVGDGPERESLEELANSYPLSAVSFLGKQPKNEVLSLMHNAQFLVLPSIWYEGFPMTIVEAFACGTAVVASNDGGMRDVIVDWENGLKFTMRESEALAEKIKWAFDHPEEMRTMGQAARAVFELKYSAEVNAKALMNIYEQALGVRAC